MKQLLFIACSIFVVISAAEGKTRFAPQISFGVEEKIRHPVAVPDDVLAVLRQDERNQTCLDEEPASTMPAKWFKASEIDLNNDHLRDLIVVADEPCLFGANIAPYWIFLKTPTGHRLVLSLSALGINVLKTKTNGTYDIKSFSYSAVEEFTSVFGYNGEKYDVKESLRKDL